MVSTIVIADDHRILRAGLRALLDGAGTWEVVGEAGDVEEVLRVVREQRPTVLLLDLHMPGAVATTEVIPTVVERSPTTRVVVLTMQDDPAFARRAFAAGALGYVLKDAGEVELLAAIDHARRDERYLSPALGARFAEPARDVLTPRETEVLRLIGLGHTSAEIAELLHLSRRTVEGHRAQVQAKLGLSGRAALVRHAMREGLLGGS